MSERHGRNRLGFNGRLTDNVITDDELALSEALFPAIIRQ